MLASWGPMMAAQVTTGGLGVHLLLRGDEIERTAEAGGVAGGPFFQSRMVLQARLKPLPGKALRERGPTG
jgi:hypothetical protein